MLSTVYEVGQIIYLLFRSKMKIVPAQIVEQTVKRTKSGEVINYSIVLSSSPEDITPLDTYNDKCEIYTSLGELEEMMRQNAIAAVTRMVKQAEEEADSAFSVKTDEVLK